MKHKIALIIVVLSSLVSAILAEDNETAKIRDKIIAMERAALDRWGRGDTQGYLEIMAPEITYFDPLREKRLDGLHAVGDYIASFTGKIRIDKYDMIEPQVQCDGNIAILTFNLVDTARPPGQEGTINVAWNSTEVYRRINGNWRIVHSHWSFTKPELKHPIP